MIIATLGDKQFASTCSYAAVFHQFPDYEIELFGTFEKCIEELKNGYVDMVCIPAAYPDINPIIMDGDLEAVDSFLYMVPDLVLAANNTDTFDFEVLYFHPATLSLLVLVDSKFIFKTKNPVNSNTEAAVVVKKTNRNICITNRLCAEQSNLKILQIVKESFSMPFVCFRKR